MRRSHLWAWAGLLALSAAPCPAADFTELLKRVPAQANAVLLIDADAARKSPHGAKEGWAKNHEKDSLGGIDSLPPTIDDLVVAGQIDPTTLDPAWRIGIASTRAAITPAQIAAAEGGTTDTVADKPVVISPRNTYYAVLSPQTVAAMHPANRQEFARWLRSKGDLTPYLRDATAKPDAPIFLALDLTDVFDPPGLRARLGKSKAMEGKAAQVDGVVKALSGLKGIRLAVQVSPDLRGELRLDTDAAAALAPVAKALVLEALEASGDENDDLKAWTARASGSSVVLSGPLSDRGLRQLIGPLLSPAITAAQAPDAGAAPDKPTAAASQKYFRSIAKLTTELHGQNPKNYTQMARSYDNYAKQIDQLPLLGVDPELQTFAMQVSVTLRGLATLGRTTINQAQLLAMQRQDTAVQVSGNSGYGNPYYGYGYTPSSTTMNASNVPQINSMIASGGANEKAIRYQTWNNIDAALAEMRRKMTAKYKVEF